MAVRQTAKSDRWEKFDKLNFEIAESGEVKVTAAHLNAPVILEDAIKMHNADHFSLRGRVSDQVKVAGKRGSLHEVNAVLATFDGLIDGTVIFPEQSKTVPRLVALVVLRDGVDKKSLTKHFRQHLDPAFVPRPILLVDELPREESGKLAKAKVLDLYQSTLASL